MEVKGFPNYIIFKNGDIYSKRKKDYMKKSDHNQGYLCVDLHHEGKRKGFLLHRLVALHFLDNPNDLPSVDHINGDKKDNRLENLRWVTYQENSNGYQRLKDCNKLGIKNISRHKRLNWYQFSKRRYGKLYYLASKDLNFLKWYRLSFCLVHGCM